MWCNKPQHTSHLALYYLQTKPCGRKYLYRYPKVRQSITLKVQLLIHQVCISLDFHVMESINWKNPIYII